jgi:branched-chain amino acid transport system permease protein
MKIVQSTKLKQYIILGLFALILIGLPFLLSNDYQLKIASFVGINTIIAVGLCLLIGYAGQISLGHAAFFGIGGYSSAILTTKYGLAIWEGLLVSLILSGLVAFVIGVPSLKLKGHYLAMATLGFGEIMYVLFVELSELTGGPSGIPGIPPFSIGNLIIKTNIGYYILVWLTALIIIFLSINIIHSRIGRALKAVHGSEPAAQAMGVHTAKYKIQIFVLSAIYAGLAGSLYAHFVNFVNPSSFTLTTSIILVTMVVIGGMANIWGAILGASILTVLPEYLRFVQEYDLIFYSIILIAVMIFMPNGIVPSAISIIDKLQTKLSFDLARKKADQVSTNPVASKSQTAGREDH